jgi:hypothetical protein
MPCAHNSQAHSTYWQEVLYICIKMPCLSRTWFYSQYLGRMLGRGDEVMHIFLFHPCLPSS